MRAMRMRPRSASALFTNDFVRLKVYEDAEFGQMEEEAKKEAEREDLTKEIG